MPDFALMASLASGQLWHHQECSVTPDGRCFEFNSLNYWGLLRWYIYNSSYYIICYKMNNNRLMSHLPVGFMSFLNNV